MDEFDELADLLDVGDDKPQNEDNKKQQQQEPATTKHPFLNIIQANIPQTNRVYSLYIYIYVNMLFRLIQYKLIIIKIL